jgi:hypothetical protein
MIAGDDLQRLKLLCEQASREHDPARLQQMVAELIDLLDHAEPPHHRPLPAA